MKTLSELVAGDIGHQIRTKYEQLKIMDIHELRTWLESLNRSLDADEFSIEECATEILHELYDIKQIASAYMLDEDMSYHTIEEALDMKARLKAKANFRRNKSKIDAGRRRAANKVATTDKLEKRARKAARKAIEDKILKGKNKNDLTFAQRNAIEKLVDAKGSAIEKLAKKILPKLKKAEQEKRSSN